MEVPHANVGRWKIPPERNKDAILVELIKYDKVNAPNSMEKSAVMSEGTAS